MSLILVHGMYLVHTVALCVLHGESITDQAWPGTPTQGTMLPCVCHTILAGLVKASAFFMGGLLSQSYTGLGKADTKHAVLWQSVCTRSCSIAFLS